MDVMLQVVSPLFKDLFAVDTQTGSVTSLTAGEQDLCSRVTAGRGMGSQLRKELELDTG